MCCISHQSLRFDSEFTASYQPDKEGHKPLDNICCLLGEQSQNNVLGIGVSLLIFLNFFLIATNLFFFWK